MYEWSKLTKSECDVALHSGLINHDTHTVALYGPSDEAKIEALTAVSNALNATLPPDVSLPSLGVTPAAWTETLGVLSDTPSEAGATHSRMPDPSTVVIPPLPGVPVEVHDSPTADLSIEPSMHPHVQSERGKLDTRKFIILPERTRAEVMTGALRLRLHHASRIYATWADVPLEVLGDVTHAEPELRAFVQNAQSFADDARRALDRATMDLTAWVKTFKLIVAVASDNEAWEYVEVASRALVDGPHTSTWYQSMEWFRAAWDGVDVGSDTLFAPFGEEG